MMSFQVNFRLLGQTCSVEVETLEAALSAAIGLDMDGALDLRIRDNQTGLEDKFWAFAEARGIDPIKFANDRGLEWAQWVSLDDASRTKTKRGPADIICNAVNVMRNLLRMR